jgi:hypothetical protein
VAKDSDGLPHTSRKHHGFVPGHPSWLDLQFASFSRSPCMALTSARVVDKHSVDSCWVFFSSNLQYVQLFIERLKLE